MIRPCIGDISAAQNIGRAEMRRHLADIVGAAAEHGGRRREITFKFADFDSLQITLSAIRLPTSKSPGPSFLAVKGITATLGCIAAP